MPFNVLASSPRGSAAGSAAATAQGRTASARASSRAATSAAAASAQVLAEERARLALVIHEQVDGLLVGLRLDVDWLDQCLAEQAGSSGDAARTRRLQMRIRCDGMGDQIDRLVENLGRIVAELQPGAAIRAGKSAI